MHEVFTIEFISASRRLHGEDEAIDYVFGLLDIPWWYYVIAAVLAVVIGRLWRWEGGLLAGYAFFLLAETVLMRRPFTGEHLRLEVLWSWREWKDQKEQILTNVLMFLPVGVLAGKLWRWKGLWIGLGLSIAIELLQLITARGLMEFDDVIHNMIGAVIGVGVVVLMKTVIKRCKTEARK